MLLFNILKSFLFPKPFIVLSPSSVVPSVKEHKVFHCSDIISYSSQFSVFPS